MTVPEPDVVAASLAATEVGGKDFVLVEWVDPPAGESGHRWVAPVHVHHEDDEVWYVLSGRLVVWLDGEEVEVAAGGAVTARAGTPHTYGNAGTEPARYLLVMTPRIRSLVAALHDPVLAAGRSVPELFADHRSEILGDLP